MAETNIFTRFLAAQKQFPNIAKDKKAQAFKGGSYTYADVNDILAKVVPVLNANGLMLVQKTTGTETSVSVETVVYSEDGQSISSGAMTVSTTGLMQKGAQAHGSATTYARRYSLVAFLGLAYGCPDDDGQEAVRHYYEKPTKPVQKTVQAKATKPGPEHNYEEMYRLITNASNMDELTTLAGVMKMTTNISADETNSLRALWASKRDEFQPAN